MTRNPQCLLLFALLGLGACNVPDKRMERAMYGHSRPAWIAGGAAYGDALMSASDNKRGTELFRFDGRRVSLVADINKGQNGKERQRSSHPMFITRVGKKEAYFSARTEAKGRELYHYDGRNVNLVFDFWNGPRSSDPRELTPLGNMLLFAANDGVKGRELWAMRGNLRQRFDLAAGAMSSSPGGLTALGDDKVFFRAADTSGDIELYVFDNRGARRVKDIRGRGSSRPANFVVWNEKVWFAATTDAHGRELYSVDRSLVVTRVTDIAPLVRSSSPSQLTPSAGFLSFVATDADGTRKVFAINAAGQITKSQRFGKRTVRGLTAAGPDFAFALVDRSNTPTGPRSTATLQIFRPDPTKAVTAAVKVNKVVNPAYLTATSGGLLFRGENPQRGREPWTWDRGTGEAGFVAGSGGKKPRSVGPATNPTGFHRVGKDRFLFAAIDRKRGCELWRTNGRSLDLVGDIDRDGPALPILKLRAYKSGADWRIQAKLQNARASVPTLFATSPHLGPPRILSGYRGALIVGDPRTTYVGLPTTREGESSIDVALPKPIPPQPPGRLPRNGWPTSGHHFGIQAVTGPGSEYALSTQFFCTYGINTIHFNGMAATVEVPFWEGCVDDVTREWSLTMERVPNPNGETELEVGYLALAKFHRGDVNDPNDDSREKIPFAPGEESIPILLNESHNRQGTVDFELPQYFGDPNGSLIELWLFPYEPTDSDFGPGPPPRGGVRVWQSYC